MCTFLRWSHREKSNYPVQMNIWLIVVERDSSGFRFHMAFLVVEILNLRWLMKYVWIGVKWPFLQWSPQLEGNKIFWHMFLPQSFTHQTPHLWQFWAKSVIWTVWPPAWFPPGHTLKQSKNNWSTLISPSVLADQFHICITFKFNWNKSVYSACAYIKQVNHLSRWGIMDEQGAAPKKKLNILDSLTHLSRLWLLQILL